jgi:hypothetical protein
MKKVERTVFLDEDAAELLIQLAGGPRKQGEYLSDLLRREARKDPLAVQVETLSREAARLRADLARVEEELRRRDVARSSDG